MKLAISVHVQDHREALAIERGLKRPDVAAFVRMIGILEALPSQHERERVLTFLIDQMESLAAYAERKAAAAARPA